MGAAIDLRRIAVLAAIAALVFGGPSVVLAQRNLNIAGLGAQASEQRVALVIGNAAYQGSPLKNPVNDARAVAERLSRLGFTVIKRENVKSKEIGAALREFRSRLSPGAVALFFYAGHGLQVKGVNYLPAVDADIDAEEDVYTQALDVSKVVEMMEEARTRVNLVFLDACRNNPFTRRFRSTAGGLAKIDAASGTLISFATRPGSVAADGDGTNGLYTEHLLKYMDQPGLPIEQVLKRVGAGVKLASKGRQEPWSEGLIEGDFFFRSGTSVASAPTHSPVIPAPVRLQSAAEIEQELWDAIKDSRDPKNLEEYLASYPSGRFAAVANARLRNLKAPTPPQAAPAPAVQMGLGAGSTGTQVAAVSTSFSAGECTSLVRTGSGKVGTDPSGAVADLRKVAGGCEGKVSAAWMRKAYTNLGSAYAVLKQWDQALQQSQTALHYGETWVIYTNIAAALSEGRGGWLKNGEIMANLEKAIQLGGPGSPPTVVLDIGKSWGDHVPITIYSDTSNP